MAFDISYNDISKELLSTAKRLNSSAWNVPPVFGDVIESHGGIKKSVIGPRLNVSDFIDENCTSGTYLLLTSSTPTSRSHHIICVIDGKLYDSWDSSNEYVVSYYVVPEISTRNFTNITEEFESLMLYAIDCLEKCGNRYLETHGLEDATLSIGHETKVDGYSFYISVLFNLDRPDIRLNTSFNIPYVFTPTTTLESAKEYVSKISKVRMYDRLHVVDQKVSQTSEGIQLYKASGYRVQDIKSIDSLCYDGQERRFYNSLPGWVKPFITYLYVSNPGQYFDSYRMTIRPIAGDPNPDEVRFRGYTSKDILYELELYKSKGFKRLGADYSI